MFLDGVPLAGMHISVSGKFDPHLLPPKLQRRGLVFKGEMVTMEPV